MVVSSCGGNKFKHFNMEGYCKKGVKRVIENTTTVKIN
jgi:hypothetical protein